MGLICPIGRIRHMGHMGHMGRMGRMGRMRLQGTYQAMRARPAGAAMVSKGKSPGTDRPTSAAPNG